MITAILSFLLGVCVGLVVMFALLVRGLRLLYVRSR
jgi:hypothetical protein